MFISYDIRNGIEYAKLCISKRSGKTVSKDYIYLGKVIDKTKFIFQSRERGIFTYNPIDNSYTPLQENIDQNINISNDIQPVIKENTNNNNAKININEKDNINEKYQSNITLNDYVQNTEIKQINDNNYQYPNTDRINNKESINNEVNSANIIDKLKFECILDYGDVKLIDDIFKQYKLDTLLNFNTINKILIIIIYFSIMHSELSINYIQYWYNSSYIKQMYPNFDMDDVKNAINDLRNLWVTDLNKHFYEQNHITYIPNVLIINGNNVYDSNSIFITNDIKLISNDVEYLLFKNIDDYDALENRSVLTSVNCIISVSENDDIYQLFADTYILGTEKVIKYNEKFYKLGFMNVYHNDQKFYVYAFQDILKNSRETINVIEKSADISANLLEEALQINFDHIFMTTKEIIPNKLLEFNENINMSDLRNKNVTNCNVVDFVKDVVNFILKKSNLSLQGVLFITRNQKCYVDENKSFQIQERNSEISRIYYELDL